ncbi:MAG: ABC transporter permease [Chloroflexota bacterium]
MAKNPDTQKTVTQRLLQPLVIPLLAILTSLIIGALVIIFTAENPLVGLQKVATGYWGIIDGALFRRNGITNTLVATTPLILTGLAVAIPFQAGLFNIGAEGQFIIGAFVGTMTGIYLDLPPVIHAIIVMIAGFTGGALWGFIPGFLRARLGAHEVINTIMLNFVGILLVNFAVRGPFKDPNTTSIQTLPIQESAEMLRIAGRLHLGFFVAIIVAAIMYYFLFRTTWGFSLRTTGQNPDAAEYAGIRPKNEYIKSMVIAGGLAGLAGVLEVQGLTRVLTEGFASGYGFDAIAVSLLALNNPLAIIPAAFVFGILRIGGDFLQIRAGLSIHIVSILQALILLFVSATAIVRYLYRLKLDTNNEGAALSRGWGG